MPSQSKQQQKFMGMVHALKKGDMNPSDASPELKKAAQSMSGKDAKDFAATKHKGLPRKVKQEILHKLKEYANKMGTNTMGGDDYTSSKKGGLRDNDGYDNVDYNKDMPMDESNLKGQLAGDSVDSLIKSIGSRFVEKEIKNTTRDGKTYIKLKDEKFGSGVVKILKSRFGIDAKVEYFGGKGKIGSTPSVSFYSDTILEGKLPNNWMQGRTSDYHTQLRGKKKDYSGGTNFKKDNSGQPDLEDEKLIDEASPCWNGYKQVGMKTKGGKQVPNCVKESVNEAPFHALNNPRFKKATSDLVKNKKIKNPETKKDVSLTTALKDKDHPAHNQAKSLFQRLKSKLVGEYGQRLDLSYLEDEEARLDGTPPPKDAINRDLNETMIRKAADIAQKLLPKDTFSRYAKDGQKNQEFVKNIVRDLTQSLNKFYKNHDISVRIRENQEDSNVDMVLGVLSILRQIDDKENRNKVAVDMIRKFKEQNIDFDYQEFLGLMKEYSMGSYEYNK